MNREWLARILTITVLAGALLFALVKKQGWTNPSSGLTAPEDAVYAMLDAARQGDVKTYLASFAGSQKTQLQQSILESSEAGFRKYLQDMNSALKGVAVGVPEPLTASRVKVRIEYTYQDRTEAQVMFLEHAGTAWKIVEVDPSDRIPTVVPYGTPVEAQ